MTHVLRDTGCTVCFGRLGGDANEKRAIQGKAKGCTATSVRRWSGATAASCNKSKPPVVKLLYNPITN